MAVVNKRPAMPLFSAAYRCLEVAEVVVCELSERSCRLDQHTDGDLGHHAVSSARRVAESLGGGIEASQILAERGSPPLTDDGVELAVEQVVVPRPEMPCSIKKLRKGCRCARESRWR